MSYQFNPECRCSWCSNGGKCPDGRWIDSRFYGRVYDIGPNDGYGDEHYPPRSLRFLALGATTLEVKS